MHTPLIIVVWRTLVGRKKLINVCHLWNFKSHGIKHFKPWRYWRVCPVINFRTRIELVKIRTSWSKHPVQTTTLEYSIEKWVWCIKISISLEPQTKTNTYTHLTHNRGGNHTHWRYAVCVGPPLLWVRGCGYSIIVKIYCDFRSGSVHISQAKNSDKWFLNFVERNELSRFQSLWTQSYSLKFLINELQIFLREMKGFLGFTLDSINFLRASTVE